VTLPLTPPEWFLERQFITAGGIVELHAFRVELLWIEPTTEPLKSARVFLVGGSLHHGHEVFIASGAATVFGRARSGAGDTEWISLARLPRQDSLKRQFVFPAVAEVVLVSSDDTRPGKVRGDWDFPAVQDQFIALQGVVIRDADLRNLARLRLRHPEKMQVIVEPTHRILEGDMKVPEAIGLGDLDASPDGWSHVQEAEPELVHVSLLSHW